MRRGRSIESRQGEEVHSLLYGHEGMHELAFLGGLAQVQYQAGIHER